MDIDEIRALCNRVITREIPVSLTHKIEGPTMFAEEVGAYLRNGGKVKVFPTGTGGEVINVDSYEMHRGEIAYEF